MSKTQLGALLSSFFWTYVLVQLFGIAGWLTDRFPVGWVLAIGYFLWSAATAGYGLDPRIHRILPDAAASWRGRVGGVSLLSKILASDFPQHHRGLAELDHRRRIEDGSGAGTLLGGVLMARLGWRWFFIGLGIGSLVWLIPWIMYMPRDRAAEAVSKHKGPGLVELLGQRSAWGCFIAHFCGNYYWFFLLTWLPSYLVQERKYSMDGMAVVGSSRMWLSPSRRSSQDGGRIARSRTACPPPLRAKSGLRRTDRVDGIVPVSIIQNETISIALLMLACMSFGVYTSNNWAITQTLSGPLAAGRWTSIQNGVGNLSGIAAPWLTGFVVERQAPFILPLLSLPWSLLLALSSGA